MLHSISSDNANTAWVSPGLITLNRKPLVSMGFAPASPPTFMSDLLHSSWTRHPDTNMLICTSKTRKITWSQVTFATIALFILCIRHMFIFSLPWSFKLSVNSLEQGLVCKKIMLSYLQGCSCSWNKDEL